MRYIDISSVNAIRQLTEVSYDDLILLHFGEDIDARVHEKIVKAAHTLGVDLMPFEYRPDHLITIIAPGVVTGDYSGGILKGAARELESLDYDAVVHGQGAWEFMPEYLAALFRTGCAGRGLYSITQDNYEWIVEQCEATGIPFVIGDYAPLGEDAIRYPSVAVDNRQAMMSAVRYLMALDHHRIGFITGRLPVTSAVARLEGYKIGLEQAGILVDDALIAEGDWSLESGQDAAEILLTLPQRPTAIIASNDLMAIGALLAAKRAGLRVPDDISLIGFDDIDMASSTLPGLTTLRQPMSDQGRAAIALLDELVRTGQASDLYRVFNAELIVRGTTAIASR